MAETLNPGQNPTPPALSTRDQMRAANNELQTVAAQEKQQAQDTYQRATAPLRPSGGDNALTDTTKGGDQSDMVAMNKNTMLTLAEQKALAAYAQYSLPKFYIPPLLVTDTGNPDDVGTGKRNGFVFLNIGDLKVEDGTFPRNVPILKVPDADIDAVQDMGFGSGTIKVSGRLWAEGGYARLQTLRELCKSRRPLIWIAQETGPWMVFPQNVPGISTVADKPYQYFFDVTFVCVAQLNAEDPTVQRYAKLRRDLVRKKFNREMALIRAQNAVKERIKNFDAITSGTKIEKGFYFDITTKEASLDPDIQELSDSDFQHRTSGVGGMKNVTPMAESTAMDKAQQNTLRAQQTQERNANLNESLRGQYDQSKKNLDQDYESARKRMNEAMSSGKTTTPPAGAVPVTSRKTPSSTANSHNSKIAPADIHMADGTVIPKGTRYNPNTGRPIYRSQGRNPDIKPPRLMGQASGRAR